MMHITNVVVVLTDGSKRPFREYNVNNVRYGSLSGRSCDLVVPFDTEYKFLIKNIWPNYRIRVDIEIDGSTAFEGLVVDPMSEVYLERFQDIAKHFKFVSVTNSNVSDPTNAMNGNISVSVHREKEPVTPLFNSNKPIKYSSVPSPYDRYLKGSSGILSDNISTLDSSISYGTRGYDIHGGIPGSVTCSTTVPIATAGATVEGTTSHQTFRKIEWAGDDTFTSTFDFHMKGKVEMSSFEKEQKLAEYNRLQAELSAAGLI